MITAFSDKTDTLLFYIIYRPKMLIYTGICVIKKCMSLRNVLWYKRGGNFPPFPAGLFLPVHIRPPAGGLFSERNNQFIQRYIIDSPTDCSQMLASGIHSRIEIANPGRIEITNIVLYLPRRSCIIKKVRASSFAGRPNHFSTTIHFTFSSTFS